MAASEMAAGYVTRKSERQGKAFKEHFSPPQVPRFLESWIFSKTGLLGFFSRTKKAFGLNRLLFLFLI